jgi:carbonic anhydrase
MPYTKNLDDLIAKNKNWSARIFERDPEFFPTLSRQQSPEYLWIGCADSRVPANEIVGLLPGELFVHRNVANVVVHTDLNCLSVMQYAVDVLKVKHIIVCGHYGCGGVIAALENAKFGLIDNWLRHIQDVRDKHLPFLASLPDDASRRGRMCELNVIEQVVNVAQTTVVRDAWARGQDLTVHGWIYGLKDGLVHPLGMDVSATEDVETCHQTALQLLASRNDS